ncbi:MAG: TrbC/VirB2 family protein [Succinivibrionaceae bacterium]
MFNVKNISLLLLSLLAISSPAFAGSSGMPYESVLSDLSSSLTGTVAKSIALIGIVGSGAALIFGGEISGFLKSIIYLVLVCSLLIMGNVIVEKFSSSGATVTNVSFDYSDKVAKFNNVNSTTLFNAHNQMMYCLTSKV